MLFRSGISAGESGASGASVGAASSAGASSGAAGATGAGRDVYKRQKNIQGMSLPQLLNYLRFLRWRRSSSKTDVYKRQALRRVFPPLLSFRTLQE